MCFQKFVLSCGWCFFIFTQLSGMIYFLHTILIPPIDHWITDLAGLSTLA